jgi:hypothetical protein
LPLDLPADPLAMLDAYAADLTDARYSDTSKCKPTGHNQAGATIGGCD